MSRRYVARDETASKAIANADRGRGTKFHSPGCWVDGHSGRHGVKGFYCAKCAPESGPEERVIQLLTDLDKRAPGRF